MNSEESTIYFEAPDLPDVEIRLLSGLPGFTEEFGETTLAGQGGWGEVYFARRQGRDVAIKFLNRQHWDRRERERFGREFKFLQALRHPALVEVFESGEWQGHPFYTMERVQGENFLTYVARQPDSLTELFRQLLEALHHIHGQGVLHRDLKAENLLVEPGGRLRVLDFGIARHMDHREHLTRTGALLGTPLYMSPEQVQGLELDERSDLYAAGILLYRALAGRTPFEGSQLHTMLYNIVHEEPDWEALQPPLRCLVQWLLQKNRDDRPRSALGLLERWDNPLHTQCPVKRQYLWDQFKLSPALTFLAGIGSGAALLAFF